MALLDLQSMDTPEETYGGGGGGNVSYASLLLCGDSGLSVLTC
ncbi:SapB/AmfS family lanthipeptide [Streptomyces sp. ACA25]|nr:SapB/AmfS family lanthipeptide [Streptomyces sp. ACA25]MDB1087787.1 SapB/AmfS family lanthipeptide [Streptomyces sp. ACA25]